MTVRFAADRLRQVDQAVYSAREEDGLRCGA